MARTSTAERVVGLGCALLGGAFFVILAKGALLPAFGVLRAVLTTVAISASIVVWYMGGELIGRLLSEAPAGDGTSSDSLRRLLRLVGTLLLSGLWYGLWLAGKSLWTAVLAG